MTQVVRSEDRFGKDDRGNRPVRFSGSQSPQKADFFCFFQLLSLPLSLSFVGPMTSTPTSDNKPRVLPPAPGLISLSAKSTRHYQPPSLLSDSSMQWKYMLWSLKVNNEKQRRRATSKKRAQRLVLARLEFEEDGAIAAGSNQLFYHTCCFCGFSKSIHDFERLCKSCKQHLDQVVKSLSHTPQARIATPPAGPTPAPIAL